MLTLPFSDACERNREPILAVLRDCLANCLQVLEIGSGTGQHAVHFAAAMPYLTWHPTERLENLAPLNARIYAEGAINLRPATALDVRQSVWPLRDVVAIFTANTLHIMSWTHVVELFTRATDTLNPNGLLCIYGPLRYRGNFTSRSNEEFDVALKARDPLSGIRDMETIAQLAKGLGLKVDADHDLPAFNRLLILTKEPVP